MRTNIELDRELVDRLMATGDFKSKRELVHEALLTLDRKHKLAFVRSLKGKLTSWEGDIDADRTDDQAA